MNKVALAEKMIKLAEDFLGDAYEEGGIDLKETHWSKTFGPMNWKDAMALPDKLNSEKHLGYTDWRMPSKDELKKAYNDGIEGFKKDFYWSSTTNAYNTSYAWYVYFYTGNVNSYGKTYGYYVRCVR